ncbi:MAG: hypothetical protein NW201_07255 [Gemmatimonadales bacterium]|nr:hypothetical protein [Gemmatimonadales bacterium]
MPTLPRPARAAIAAALLAAPALRAQAPAPAVTADDIGTVSISVVVPEDTPELTPRQRDQVDSKLTQIAAQAGLGGSGIDAGFLLYPLITLEDEQVAEGGLKNISVVTLELALFIKQADQNITFASMSRTLKGSGNSKGLAITNAITRLQAGDPEFRTFITTGKRKILEYYEKNCRMLQQEASRKSRVQDWEGALGVLMRVPKEAKTCAEAIAPDIDFAFKSYQQQACKGLIKNASANVAAQAYVQALQSLDDIDPFSPCADEAAALVDRIEGVVNQREDRDLQIALQTYDKNLEALKQLYPTAAAQEAHRMELARDVAVAYYNSKQPVVQYNKTVFK